MDILQLIPSDFRIIYRRLNWSKENTSHSTLRWSKFARHSTVYEDRFLKGDLMCDWSNLLQKKKKEKHLQTGAGDWLRPIYPLEASRGSKLLFIKVMTVVKQSLRSRLDKSRISKVRSVRKIALLQITE